MEIIQSSFSFSSLTISGHVGQQKQQGVDGNFDSLLASFSAKPTDSNQFLGGDSVFSFINKLFEQVQGSFNGDSSGLVGLQIAPKFPLSSEFESAFGASGPLPSYINLITAELGLSAEKNLAFQNIAINNKEATRSVESIEKIRSELQAAGISR